MPFLRKRSPLVLDSKDIEKLQSIQSSRTEAHSRVVRSRMLLAYAQGESVSAIARRECVSRPTVELCIDKAVGGGIDAALRDLPRPGCPPKITAEDKAWVMHLACSKPTEHGYAAELWTLKALADHVRKHAIEAGHTALCKAAKATVQRILKESSTQPHKMSYYLEKRDPQFDEKMAQVLMVYKEIEQFRKEPSTVERRKTTISYDEKPGLQAIANIAADLPPQPGKYSTWSRDYEYKRLGTVSLLAGIDLYDGHVIGLVRDRHRSREFIEFLAIADAHYPADWKIRIVLDNHSSHVSKETMQWLKKKPNRFEFVYTPKHGSWLNMIEILFSKMARSFLRGIRVSSKEELIERIYRYIDELNTCPVIFRWKYKLDEMSLA